MPELGETADPTQLVPGTAWEIRKSIAHLVTYGDTLVQVGQGLHALDAGGWTGPAADAFHEFFDGEPQRWITCGDAFHSAAQAIEGYCGTLTWAQEEAARAIALWQQGEAATRQAQTQYDQQTVVAARHVAAGGAPPPEQAQFQDPGVAQRAEAEAVLQGARDQLVTAGDQTVATVDQAQQHAPEEPTWLEELGETVSDIPGNLAHYAIDAGGNMVDMLGTAAGALTEGAGWLAGKAVGGAGNLAGEALDAVGLDEVGASVERTTQDAADATTSATADAGRTVTGWADSTADDIRGAADDVAGSLGAGDPPSMVEADADLPDYVLVDERRYPESAQHIEEAQTGEVWRGDTSEDGRPKPAELTVDRPNADINRAEALHGIASRGGDYLDRDEYPPAMFYEGGEGASVKYIDAGDNRGAGSSMSHQVRAQGLDNGDRVHIVAG